MKYRKLRIAWSVAWGLLIVEAASLWVQCYCGAGPSIDFSIGMREAKVNFGTSEVDFHTYTPPNGVAVPINSLDWWNDFDNPKNKIGFGFYRYQDVSLGTSTLVIPVWFLFTLLAIGIGIPWVRWPSRFSLFTLLYAMTMIAIATAWIAHALRR